MNKCFNERLTILGNNGNQSSLCYLNSRYYKITKKEYLNYNINCKN